MATSCTSDRSSSDAINGDHTSVNEYTLQTDKKNNVSNTTSSKPVEFADPIIDDAQNASHSQAGPAKDIQKLPNLKTNEFRIGTSINGYPSENIGEFFDFFDKSTVFIDSISNDDPRKNSKTCKFVEAKLFSEKIDLSEFYWGNLNGTASPVEEVDKHLYRLKNHENLFLRLGYGKHFVTRDIRSNQEYEVYRHFKNPIMFVCKFRPDFDFSVEKNNLEQYIGKVRKQKTGGCTSQFFYGHKDDPDFTIGGISSLFEERLPGSTIGFFTVRDDLYIVDVRLFKYKNPIGTRGSSYDHVMADRVIKVAKIDYSVKPKISNITTICDYRQKLSF